jgi:hypothetical protein
MVKSRATFDSTRASRDGHEFHEAWVARKCLGLLLHTDGLVGVAIEGFAYVDQKNVTKGANEIADAVLYYGERASFESANAVVVVQVKYSRAAELKPVRASDAKKTLAKFARSFEHYGQKYGSVARGKLRYEFVTNRPILAELQVAIDALRSGGALQGTASDQAQQILAACKLDHGDLKAFLDRLILTGSTGDLRESKHALAITLADWSPARDLMANTRLNAIRQLARDKAGLASQNRNVILRTDILAALEVSDEDALLPCPTSFPHVGAVVWREQLDATVASIPQLVRPLLIHADGGVGKTVFMNSVAGSLSSDHEVLLFDCFGMGQYRAPGDSRHLPNRGLVQIANDLACRGLCDPLLPTSSGSDDIIRAFRLRLIQASEAIRRGQPERKLVLFLDAADNAEEIALERHEPCFPRLLLESIDVQGAIPGVLVVVSTRTHRREITKAISCDALQLNTFSQVETSEFLRTRLKEPTEARALVAQSRSRGNARVLEHLAEDEVALLASSELGSVIELDDLLRERINSALSDARRRGYRDEDIKLFLASLAVLPPPVPVGDLAGANGLDDGAIRSFAADLSPLLDSSKHGLMFRDEPTEKLIRREHGADAGILNGLVQNLNSLQATSVYAASALPDLLRRLDRGDELFHLAFDDRIPSSVTSSVGRQAVRQSRIRAAIAFLAKGADFEKLVPLLVEMSTLAAGHERGSQFLLDNPDLTIISGDVSSVRRLLDSHTKWPGTRHARLSIAHALSGDVADAFRHAYRVKEWTTHYIDQDADYRAEVGGPSSIDIASISLALLAKGDVAGANEELTNWVDWFAFEVAGEYFDLAKTGVQLSALSADIVESSAETLIGAGPLAAAVRHAVPGSDEQITLIKRLAASCEGSTDELDFGDHNYRPNPRPLVDGMLFAAAAALSNRMDAEALVILAATKIARPSLHTSIGSYWVGDVYPFVARQAMERLANGNPPLEIDLLPEELFEISGNIDPCLTGSGLRSALRSEGKRVHQEREKENQTRTSYSTNTSAERFIDTRLDMWWRLAVAFGLAIRGPVDGKQGSPGPLMDLWSELRSRVDFRFSGAEAQQQANTVGERLLTLAIAASPTIEYEDADRYAKLIATGDGVSIPSVIDIASIFGRRPTLHSLSGALATAAAEMIDRENDVAERVSLLAKVGRAIAPASLDEARHYFRRGLEQVDAIGSGDYQFTSELLHFASSMREGLLSEPAAHALSNICEMNLGEAHKFDWSLFGDAMTRSVGLRGIAKLTRWEDRDRVSLDYSLLPYINSLIQAGSLDPSIALVILRVSDPAEFFACGTKDVAASVAKTAGSALPLLTSELIAQYLQNNPGHLTSGTAETLAELAKRALGDTSAEYLYLSSAAAADSQTIAEENDLRNWRPSEGNERLRKREEERESDLTYIQSCADLVDPVDELSLSKALSAVAKRGWGRDPTRELFDHLRPRVAYGDWPEYIQIIARQDDLDLYDKLHELRECRDAWASTSLSVLSALNACAETVVRVAAFDFISFDRLSSFHLSELSAISGVDRGQLILLLIESFSDRDASIPASVWLSLATEFNVRASPGVGQRALERLLNSGAGKLSAAVEDGGWHQDLYPDLDQVGVAAGLIWFGLGSPSASRRWMAAHSLRTAVALDRTNIVDGVVELFESTGAGAFSAKELPFFYLHARLWLLIALARIAVDHPAAITKHRSFLQRLAGHSADHQVLVKHFAAQALMACLQHEGLDRSSAEFLELASTNTSPYRVKKSKHYGGDTFYGARPAAIPEPENAVHLDYDFSKYDVTGLAEVFGRSYWEVADAISAWVRQYDADIAYMSDLGGRSGSFGGRDRGYSDNHHSYGEHLCWHALLAVAGSLLKTYPVLRRPYDTDDAWIEWLTRRKLTHPKGLWLADGVDWRPLDTRVNLREAGDSGPVITGDAAKLLALIGVSSSIGETLVIGGDWTSMDGIGVHIHSALAPTHAASELAQHLADMDPFQAYLPELRGDDESSYSDSPFTPWVVISSGDARLDGPDVIGSNEAVHRSKLSRDVRLAYRLTARDAFARRWTDPNGRAVAHAEVWTHSSERASGARAGATRLQCTAQFVSTHLEASNRDLVILIMLRRYREGGGDESAQFWHTTAVARINQALEVSFYPGRVNEPHHSKF